MGDFFQKVLNKARQGYKEADKRLGGYLPGGGTGNPLSKTVAAINPEDALGYAVTTTARPVQQALRQSLSEYMESGKWGTNIKKFPALMAEATLEMRRLGQPGIWSTTFPSTKPQSLGTGDLPEGVQVDLQKGGFYSLMGPHFEFEDKAIRVGPKTPAWILAHELGHAIDFYKNPSSYSYLKEIQTPEGLTKFLKKEQMNRLSPGALVVGVGGLKDDESNSLLGAGIEGALGGLGANQSRLRMEARADRYGMPLAQKAGVPWDHRKNLIAKGSYLADALYPGFAQGVVAELASRGTEAFSGLLGTAMRAFKGTQLTPMEQSLSKYGYDPKQHVLSMKGDEIQLKSRNQAEQALYDYITNPNKRLTIGY
jgi:hypothetical protein